MPTDWDFIFYGDRPKFKALAAINTAPDLGDGDGIRTMCSDTPPDRIRYTPVKILRSGNHTIVFWNDGTKTIVKRNEDEPDNIYAAFTAALAIKIFGSNSALKRMIDKKTELQKPKRDHGMKFKVGDIVRTKVGLKDGKKYGIITFWEDTMRTERSTVGIADPRDKTYRLNGFWYTEEMLELVKEGKEDA